MMGRMLFECQILVHDCVACGSYMESEFSNNERYSQFLNGFMSKLLIRCLMSLSKSLLMSPLISCLRSSLMSPK
jgi:hypothetical protein